MISEILERYRSQVDDVLTGGGRLDAILRRRGLYDSLNSGQSSPATPRPEYGPIGNVTGAPSSSSEALSDAMSFVSSLGGGPAYSPATVDEARRGHQIDVAKILDERETQTSTAEQNAMQRRDVARTALAQTGAQGIATLGTQEDAAEKMRSELISSIVGDEATARTAEKKLASEELMDRLGREKDIEVAGIRASGGGSGKELTRYDPATGESFKVDQTGAEIPMTRKPAAPALTPYQKIMAANSTATTQFAAQRNELDALRYELEEKRASSEEPGPTGISPQGKEKVAIAKEEARIATQDAIANQIDTVLPMLQEMEALIKGGTLTLGPVAGKLPTTTEDGQRFMQLSKDLQLLKTTLLKGGTSDRDFAHAISSSVGETYSEGVNLKAVAQTMREIKSRAKRYGVTMPGVRPDVGTATEADVPAPAMEPGADSGTTLEDIEAEMRSRGLMP